MLELIDITKIYVKGGQEFPALDHVSLKVGEGEFVAVVGASGSGKSTLLHVIGGLNRQDSGQVLYRGTELYKMKSNDLNLYRKQNIGFVFQQFHLVPYLTVFENVEIAGQGQNGQDINELLEKCSLLPLKDKYPSELSVGEKQRTAFVRAIISKPEILLADEPTGNLDPENSEIIMSLIQEYNNNGGTVLLVSHEKETAQYASRTIALRAGQIVSDTFK